MKNLKEYDIDALLLTALKKEPEIDLPHGFATVTARKLRSKPVSAAKTYGLAILATVVAIAVVAGMLQLSQSESSIQLLSVLFHFKYIIAFVILAGLSIEYLDQTLVRSPGMKR